MARERITPLQLFILQYVAGRNYPQHSSTIREVAQRQHYNANRAWAAPAICSAVSRCLKTLVSKGYLRTWSHQGYYSGAAYFTYSITTMGLALLRERHILTVNGDPHQPLSRETVT